MIGFIVRKKYRPPWQRKNSDPARSKRVSYSPDPSSSSSSSANDYHKPLGIEDINVREPYSYSKLPGEDGIRILRLLPGRAGDPIQVQVQCISMSADPEYTAVSYAWGDRMALRTIFCEGKFIQIPINLYRALTYMRHPLHPIHLWVDAICINQEDEVEKSCQVRRMRTIFTKAKKVTVWVGQDIKRSAKGVFQTIDAIAKQDFGAVPPPEDLFWRDVERLFRKKWFSRIWCLQEIVLAADANVQWGTEVAPWKTVAETATWIRSCPVQLLRSSATGGTNNAHLMHMLGGDLKQNKLVSFLELLALSWQFKSSDTRDRVYGLLGVPTTDSNPTLGDVFIQPDYTKSDAEIYHRCAFEIIQKTHSLRLLLHVQTTRYPRSEDRYRDLPSWVPRWNRYILPMIAPSEQVPSFNACAALPSSPPRVENDTLFAQGRKLSQVQIVDPDTWNLNCNRNPQRVVSRAWKDYLELSRAYEKGDETLKAWCLLLTAGKDWSGELVSDTQQHLADMGAYMCDDVSDIYLNLPKIPGAETGDGYRFDLAFKNAYQGRKLLLTDDGYVGIGPVSTRKNDFICLLSGLVMPIILRPTDKGYQVVGEVYVHGIMFGEASGKPGTELEEFVIH
ncbi:heterokaryon incompatibility protein-domain-containing protein [Xylaria telfairii]|nr:heterokaryon incompatibility protein-domain-containing protein [Xylaria telfairii]